MIGRRRWWIALAMVLMASSVQAQTSMGTAFTYQGTLMDGGVAANGTYDVRARLYTAVTGGSQVGSTLTFADITVSDGLVELACDFGSGAFTADARWLELDFRAGASTGAYTTLAPRARLRPTPQALYAASAATASAVPWSGITSMPADFSDGVDDEGVTSVSQGTGITVSGTTDVTVAANTSVLQARVTGTCSGRTAIRLIAVGGGVGCTQGQDYYTIPAAAFASVVAENGLQIENGEAYLYIQTKTPLAIVAPFNPPPGTTLLSFTVYHRDTYGGDIEVTLRARDHGAGAEVILSDIWKSSNGAAPGNLVDLGGLAVDFKNYAYYFHAEAPNNWGGGELAVFSVRVEYTVE